ncbi:MAG: hypothetical protein E7668_04990 [Ruminococcaceae bacterium]|nr:hypothetical protein [Oscillospiraceae bacterium]
MSVRKGDRGEGKLQVLNKARELKKYSLGIVRSEKHFPKSTRWLYASPIAEEIREACICIRHANSVYVSSEDEYRYRRMEQTKAHAHLDALLDLIDDAYDAGYIEGRQAEYWTGLILQTDDLLKAWIKSDREKYQENK